MKTTLKNRVRNGWMTGQFFFSGMLLMALTVAPLGCTEEGDDEGAEQVSAKAGALSDANGEKTVRQHRGSGRHDRQEGVRQGKRGGKDKMGRRGRKGRDRAGILIKTALQQDSLTAEQREKIEALVARKREARNGARKEGHNVHRAGLAEAVRDGKVDAVAMQARFEERAAQREAKKAARAEDLSTLFATLDASQRQAVVDAVKARREQKGRKNDVGAGFDRGKRGKRAGGRGEHVMGERTARSGEGKGFCGKHGGHGGRGAGIFRLVKGLELTEEQQTQIATLTQELKANDNGPDKEQRKAKREEMKQCRVSFIESFTTESFNPAAAVCRRGADVNRQENMNQRIAGFSTLLGILTEEQRNQLADRLENPPVSQRRAREM